MQVNESEIIEECFMVRPNSARSDTCRKYNGC